MKKLLLSSFLLVFVLAYVSCSNFRNKAVNKTNTENAEIVKGDSVSSKSSNTVSSEKGSRYKEVEIKHNAPNQAEIDSIKREKSKGKK
jgi:hypothetical protein